MSDHTAEERVKIKEQFKPVADKYRRREPLATRVVVIGMVWILVGGIIAVLIDSEPPGRYLRWARFGHAHIVDCSWMRKAFERRRRRPNF